MAVIALIITELWSTAGNHFFKWHADNRIFPNEKLKGEDAKRIGYFVLHQGNWWLVNENLTVW